jgi:CAF1 family ribonuclease
MDINRLQIPIIIHNGLMDLMYLYYSFYTDLPSNLQVFAADLSDMFPGGIYDTKYISDYVSKEPVSFLSYLFKKYEREEKRRLAMLNNPDQNHGEKYTKRCFRLEIQSPFSIEQIIKTKANDVEQEDPQDGSSAQASSSRKKRRRKYKGSSTPKEEKLYCEQYAVSGNYNE